MARIWLSTIGERSSFMPGVDIALGEFPPGTGCRLLSEGYHCGRLRSTCGPAGFGSVLRGVIAAWREDFCIVPTNVDSYRSEFSVMDWI